MDLNSIIQGVLPTLVGNAIFGGNTSAEGGRPDAIFGGNTSAEGGLPDAILDTLSPLLGLQFNPLMRLFMLLYNVLGGHLGIDPTYILISLGSLWAVNKLWNQLYTRLYALAQQYFTASIEVSGTDDIYIHLMEWFAAQRNMTDSRSLAAKTVSKCAWEEEEFELNTTRVSPDGTNIYYNYSHQEAKTPPRFIPALGRHSFWFRGRYFELQRKQEAVFYPNGPSQGMPKFKDKEKLVLLCFGRSPEPIKLLLQHVKELYYLNHQAKTIVRCPAGPTMRQFGELNAWLSVASRPVRPMNTVVLDDGQKTRILNDMNDYLHPASARWYANRGIPLRRGYLFHGPPGTGKTSLSTALAGVFGLDIYVISLRDPTLTEQDLLALFKSLPRRCVVLLEDIDTAGLKRSTDDDVKSRKRRGCSDSSDKNGISLSGLLNAIDGVASHEGRLLIMTTNKPEALDEALIRPGRIDLQVAFANATKEQAQELFIRMYMPDSNANITATTETKTAIPKGITPEKASTPLNLASLGSPLTLMSKNTTADLADLAAQFAAAIPNGEFSPAELQEFLLGCKGTPEKALAEVGGWVEKMVAQKRGLVG